jgi:phosphohistidine phosphatase
MEQPAAHLVCGRLNRPVFTFQNSGIVCLDREEDGDSRGFRWSLMPKIG